MARWKEGSALGGADNVRESLVDYVRSRRIPAIFDITFKAFEMARISFRSWLAFQHILILKEDDISIIGERMVL